MRVGWGSVHDCERHYAGCVRSLATPKFLGLTHSRAIQECLCNKSSSHVNVSQPRQQTERDHLQDVSPGITVVQESRRQTRTRWAFFQEIDLLCRLWKPHTYLWDRFAWMTAQDDLDSPNDDDIVRRFIEKFWNSRHGRNVYDTNDLQLVVYSLIPM